MKEENEDQKQNIRVRITLKYVVLKKLCLRIVSDKKNPSALVLVSVERTLPSALFP